MATLVYDPAPTVDDFICHYTSGALFADWLVGPFGSGKTTGLFFKLCYMAQLQEPSPIDGVRHTRAIIVRNTGSQLNDTTIKSFDYWFKDGQAGEWKATNKTFVLRWGDVECEVLFRPLDDAADVQRVLSLEVTFAILDEFVQIPRAIVEGLSGRCGRYPPVKDGGATNWGMWGASNPSDESNWWFKLLEDPDPVGEQSMPANWKYYKQPSGFSPHAENIDKLPGNDQYYTNLAQGKTERWVQQFIEVKWVESQNGKPVFPMFRREIHVAKHALVPDPKLPLVAGYDPGMQSAMVIGQFDMNGRLLIYDEIILEDVDTERMIAEYLRPLLLRKYNGFEFLIVPDPAAGNRNAANGASVIRVLRYAGFAVKQDTDNTILSRLEPMQHYMMRLTNLGPALYIDPGCIKLVRALAGGYKYAVIGRDETRKEVPEKNQHSHVADAATYLARYFKSGADKAGKKLQDRRIIAPKFHNSYNMR